MTGSLKQEMDIQLFIPHQSQHFSSVDNLIKLLFHFCTLNWRVNIYFSCQGKGIDRRDESTTIII